MLDEQRPRDPDPGYRRVRACPACLSDGGVVTCSGACDHVQCHGTFMSSPRGGGKVYCCVTLGWVYPEEALEHSMYGT